jgi:hypothetical protein
VTSAVVEVRVNARIGLVGEVGAVRTGVGGVGVAVVTTARGQAARGSVLAAVAVDAGVGLVGEVGVVRASGGGAGAGAVAAGSSSSAIASGASASASSGGDTGASCGVFSAVVYIGVS